MADELSEDQFNESLLVHLRIIVEALIDWKDVRCVSSYRLRYKATGDRSESRQFHEGDSAPKAPTKPAANVESEHLKLIETYPSAKMCVTFSESALL